MGYASFRHCDIEESGGSGGNWDSSMGMDGGGNIDDSPEFLMTFLSGMDDDGPDDEWMTPDDGIKLHRISPCLDRADGDFAPERDICGEERLDVPNCSGGTGTPDYVDIGAYESRKIWSGGDGPVIVAMVWIDESVDDLCPGCVKYYSDAPLYDEHVSEYQALLSSIPYTVMSGCLVPPNPDFDDYPWMHGIVPVLPEGYDPPEDISVETCGRPPTANELMADFDRIREGLVPDVIILSVDNSGSMETWMINPGYSDFKSQVKQAYPDAQYVERDNCSIVPPGCFRSQAWVDELRTQIESVVGQ